ncbi:MAG: SpoIIE family protein phosphatase [Desulfobacterales bacterium]|nr:MAG: SpoIIE family protein phosphatase [Desulfobacterales bacterium]
MKASASLPPHLIGLYLCNFGANLAGQSIIVLLNFFTPLAAFRDWQTFLLQRGLRPVLFFIPLVFLTAGVLQYMVQRPISMGLQQMRAGGGRDAVLGEQARRRLLNLPYVLGIVNLAMWIILTGLIVLYINWVRHLTAATCFYIFFRGVMVGLIASFIVFFLVDDYSRRKLVPMFFPEGKLAALRGTIKISILRRIRVLFGVGTNAPIIILVGTLSFVLWERGDLSVSAAEFGRAILFFAMALGIIFVPVALSLNFLVGRSILKPIKEMMALVKKVRNGDFHQRIRVVSNDELGVLGDGMNEMTGGLLERERLRQSLILAREVQQNLLPRTGPQVQGLDIAATSVYCDETGGDYYDFLETGDPRQGKIGVVVGDVSGHGIPSALLMASARAFLRQRADLPGSLAQIVSDVNRQLARDVEESGGFMTLFYLTVDAANDRLHWVRAGHDPAIFYDPVADEFESLFGEGLALGVKPNWQYEEYQRNNLARGQIIVIGTDGIWEARNPRGAMFGKERVYGLIRRNAAAGAQDILDASLEALRRFQQDRSSEDDVTLVVIKIVRIRGEGVGV